MKWTCNTTWVPGSRPDHSGEHCWPAQLRSSGWVFLGYMSKLSAASARKEWTQPLAELPPQAEGQVPAAASEDWSLPKAVVQSPATSPPEGESSGPRARERSGLRSSIARILWEAASGADRWLGGRPGFG